MKAFLKIRFLGLLSAAGFLACAGTVLGFLGLWSWFFELFVHFRVQYMAGLLGASVILFLVKHQKEALVYLVFSLVNLGCLLSLFQSKPTVSPTEYPVGPRRAMLININSEMGDPELVMEAIHAEDPEILVLEEVTAAWMRALEGLTNRLPYSVARPREDNFGIALFSKHPLMTTHVLFLGEAEVPSLLASLKVDGRVLEILATHPLPPAGSAYAALRNEQLDRVAEYVKGRSPLLLLGDLNMTPWSPPFKRFMAQSKLHDSATGFGLQPSWPSYFWLMGIPIDHCFYSDEIWIADRRIGPHVGSDHLPLIIDFALRAPLANLTPNNRTRELTVEANDR